MGGGTKGQEEELKVRKRASGWVVGRLDIGEEGLT